MSRNEEKRLIYLDNAATTRLDPEVLDVMMPYLTNLYGNPSSVHRIGRQARHAVEEARNAVALEINADPEEILFTSGGTEASNMAIRGTLIAGGHLITMQTEHEAVLEPARSLEKTGIPVTFLKPGCDAVADTSAIRAALRSDTRLVSVMHVNNETGAVNPVFEIARLSAENGVPFHCDAVQSAGLFALDVSRWDVDLLSMSGHKIHGPKGIGALFVRGGLNLPRFIDGGSQEQGRRGGTENVAGIIGFAKALTRAAIKREKLFERLSRLQKRMLDGLRNSFAGTEFLVNSPVDSGKCSPHILSLSFPPTGGVSLDGEMLLLNLDMAGICVSSGSACTSGAVEPSHVLLAAGVERQTAAATVRFSFSEENTEEEIDVATEALVRVVRRMRGLAG